MKIKIFMMAVALAVVLPISVRAATVGGVKAAVPSSQLNPQPEPPRALSGMTEAQFQALPPNATVLINNKPVPKSEVQRRLDKQKAAADIAARAAAQKRIAKFSQHKSQFLVQKKAALQAANATLEAQFTSTRSAAGMKSQQKQLLQVLQPQIVEVRGANDKITPYGWVAIKGVNFGEKAGKVVLDLSSGGTKELVVREWYDDAIMAEVPHIDKVPDQRANLVVKVGTLSATNPVLFTALRELQWAAISVINCDKTASFHNSCGVSSGIFEGVHINFPDDQTIRTGNDKYQFILKPGWKLATASDFNSQDPYYSPLYASDICGVSGSIVTCSWSTLMKTNNENALYGGNVAVLGPEGMDP
jgi:hypothetical protein